MAATLISLNARALTNSVPADGPEYESVALIGIDVHNTDDPDGSTTTGYCNASVLSPELLVTAAHCLKDAIVMGSTNLHVEIGKYIYVKRHDGKIVRVGYGPYLRSDTQAQFLVPATLLGRIQNEGYSTTIAPEEDLGAIILARPLALPLGFEFARTASQAEVSEFSGSPASYSPMVVSVNLAANQNTLDTKRMASLDQLDFTGFFSSNSSSRVEEGDSGAPLRFKSGSGFVLGGVVKGRGESAFGNWDAFTPLGDMACDIARQLPDSRLSGLLCH